MQPLHQDEAAAWQQVGSHCCTNSWQLLVLSPLLHEQLQQQQ